MVTQGMKGRLNILSIPTFETVTFYEYIPENWSRLSGRLADELPPTAAEGTTRTGSRPALPNSTEVISECSIIHGKSSSESSDGESCSA